MTSIGSSRNLIVEMIGYFLLPGGPRSREQLGEFFGALAISLIHAYKTSVLPLLPPAYRLFHPSHLEHRIRTLDYEEPTRHYCT